MSILGGNERIAAIQRALDSMTSPEQVKQFMAMHKSDAIAVSMADQKLQQMTRPQATPPQPTVVDQKLQQAQAAPMQGVAALDPGTAVPEQGYAGGGIVAFARGGDAGEGKDPKLAYRQYALTRAAAMGIDPKFVDTIFGIESKYDPNAQSPTGPVGIGQLTKATAKAYGVSPDERKDPYKNIDASLRFMADLNKKYGGDPQKMALAYNQGEPVADRHLKDNGGKINPDAMGSEPRKYIAKMLTAMAPGTNAQAGELPKEAPANEAPPKEAPKTADKKDDATFGFWDARNVAPILDTFVSPISGAARLGTYLGGRFQGMSPDEASENARRITQETIPIDRPFGRALGITETPEYKNEPTQQFTNWVGGGIGNITKKASDATGASAKFDQRDIDAARDVALLGIGRLAQGVPKGRAPNVPRAATVAEAEASQAAKAAAARAAAEAEAKVSATRLPAPSTASQPRLPAPNKATLVVDEAGNVVQGPAVQGAGAAGQAADAAAQAAATQRGLAGLAADKAAATAARTTAEGIQTLAKPLTAAEKAGRVAANAVRATAPVVAQGVKLNAFGNAEPSEDGEGGMDYPETEYQSGPHPRNVPAEMAPEVKPEVPVEDRTGTPVEPKSRFTNDDWLMAGLATLQEAGKSGSNWATSIGAGGIEGLKNRRTRASDEAKQAMEQAQMDLYRNQGKWYGSREDIERSKLEAKAEGADAALRKVALQQATQLLNKEMADPTSMLNRMGLSGPELEAMRQRRLLELSGLAYQQLGGSTTMGAGATVPGVATLPAGVTVNRVN